MHDLIFRQKSIREQQRPLVTRIREVVRRVVPPGAPVLVMNQGNEDLLKLEGRTAWPFPHLGDGTDTDGLNDDQAITHLEELRAKGPYLVVPAPASAGQDSRPRFRRYLETHCAGLLCREDCCLIYDLHDRPTPQERQQREQLLDRIREIINRYLPPEAPVLVMSCGEEGFLKLGGRPAAHFPHTATGAFAGFPADSAEAITQLRSLRDQGARYFLIPPPSFRWLNHYAEFHAFLASQCGTLVHHEEICFLFDLQDPSTKLALVRAQWLNDKVREVVEQKLLPNATVTVISEGDDDLLQLRGRKAWHFPRTPDGAHTDFPATSAEAIAHLEGQRAGGAEYLLVPAGALAKLDSYPEFWSYLNRHCRLVARETAGEDQDICIIYALQRFRKRKPASRPFGVNVAGCISSEKGMGEAARADIRSLEALRVPFVLNPFVDAGSANRDATFTGFADQNPYLFNLIHLNADAVPAFVCQKGEKYFHGRYNIAWWAWELSNFPDQWDTSFQYYDEIWVPSTFALDAVSRAARVPVVRVPLSLRDLPLVRPNRSRFGVADAVFVFLFIFDFHSVTERKNPRGLIQAFREAFPNQRDVVLLLKGSHPSPGEVEALQEAAAGANVRILDHVMSRAEVDALLQLSDCYVSLHRSEGFGLTMAEAMSLGKPVIATAYSGNLDFMTLSNSFLVNHQLKTLDRDYGPYRRGWVWADPDLDHAAALMRAVYENQGAAQAVGRQAHQDILAQLHPRQVGRVMKDRLAHIAGLRNLPLPAPAYSSKPLARQQRSLRR
jgi:glycosyltransferase involved in cell wall biosynthesis